MTNKEAIETLKTNYPDACFEQLREAVDAAISALQALDVPDTNVGDTISRQDAIDAIMGQPPEPHYPSWYAEWLKQLPSAQPNVPDNDVDDIKPCEVCDYLEDGDTLYKSSDWDGGIGFDYIRDIRYCPNCGRRL